MKMPDSGKWRENCIKLASFAVAAVFALTIVRFWYQSVDAGMNREYQVVALGDSVIGKERDDDSVTAYAERVSGFSVYNGAFGGNCASADKAMRHYSYHEESLSLCRMAEAVSTKDFGVQSPDMTANQVRSWYFEDGMAGLSEIDFDKTEMFLIEFGVNDYSSGRSLENPENPLDVYTYGGALRYSVEKLREAYPAAKLVMVTPAYCWLPYGHEVCTKEDFGGGTLDKYADLQKEIAKEYDMDVIDVFYELGIDENNVSYYTEDGLHLNNEGRELYGNFLGEKIKELMEKR